ncbi:hypothetical protein IEQ34_012952 [Dendrobium chrysotoxum]|uniref:Uncharacterized protein n=1 Tax=Dendrobium chrysotoxum TaxID=161865 RepID=A0AAV7GQ00_DENCH|nr:hypothetical protein IEQ34_012952 [Dendrobium chrysotoxum]
MTYGVSLSQLSYRAMSIIMGLIMFFQRSWSGNAFLGWVILSVIRMIVSLSDPSGWIFVLEIYQEIGLNLQEKWGKLKNLPIPLHIGAENLLKVLNLPDVDTLHYEVCYLNRYIDEEFLFKVGLSTQVGRSHAHMLKKSAKVPEAVTQPSKAPPKWLGNEGEPQASKKKMVKEILTVTSKGHHLVKHIDLKIEMTKALNDWNTEFIKVKCLQREYKKKYDGKIKEMKVVEKQLAECRAKLTTMAVINQHVKDQKTLEEKIAAIEVENKKLQSLLSEKEAISKSEQSPSRVIEEFKKFVAFKMIVQDQIQKARDHIYDMEVKALELECMEEGFIKGFLKGVRLLQRKTGAEIEGLMPSQASSDSSSDFDCNEVENDLQKAFALEDEDKDDVEILQYYSIIDCTTL